MILKNLQHPRFHAVYALIQLYMYNQYSEITRSREHNNSPTAVLTVAVRISSAYRFTAI